MVLDPENTGHCAVEDYEEAIKILENVIHPEVLAKVVETCTDETGMISFKRLSILIDKYKFLPKKIRKMKNNSYNFWRLALKGKPYFTKKKTNLQEHFSFLSEKIEEKFAKLSQAFRFFDNDRDGKINMSDFMQGLNNL